VFLSSAWYGIDKIRQRLADWLERSNYDAFVFEKFKQESEWKALLPAAREAICLEHVGRSRLYIGLFRTTYGSSARDHSADIAFTDLELFEAFRAGVPIRLYLLEDAPPEPRLQALLTLVETVLPGALVRCTAESDLMERVTQDVDVHFGRAAPVVLSPSKFARYARALIQNRKVNDDRDEGLRFLLDRYPPPSLLFDPELVRAELNDVGQLPSYEARLNGTWRVFQRLFHVPWTRIHDHLALWDEALGVWETAAAWRGLHGFTYAGRLSADNTLVAVRVLTASRGERSSLMDLMRRGDTRTETREEWIKLYATGGALASEYYSIAKQAPRRLKTHYLGKADAWIAVAERTFAMAPSPKRDAGLASIRGHIFLEWGRVVEAVPLLERSLHLREEASLGPASVGEAEVDLGYAYYVTGRRREGEHLMAEGLADLERHGSPGFLARAKRKVARVYWKGWDLRKALAELVDVKALVDTYGLNDQGREVRWLAHVPQRLLRALSPTRNSGRPNQAE
jgi:hypothetical protein